jgi:cephalosporin-C deacetylase-like acetyl esterase
MVKWLNPRQFSQTGRGIIMGAIDAVYDLIRVKLKIFLSFPLMDAVATPSCKQPQCVDLKKSNLGS